MLNAPMTPYEFISKARASALGGVLGLAGALHPPLTGRPAKPMPAEADPTGEAYCFERGAGQDTAAAAAPMSGSATHLAWEPKGKRTDLDARLPRIPALPAGPGELAADRLRHAAVPHLYHWTNTVSKTYKVGLDEQAARSALGLTAPRQRTRCAHGGAQAKDAEDGTIPGESTWPRDVHGCFGHSCSSQRFPSSRVARWLDIVTVRDMLRTQGPPHVAAADPVMAALIPRIGPCALPRRRSPYAALVRSILAQQLSTAAASTIHCRLQTTLGGPISLRRVQRASDDALLATGLSHRKLRFIRELTCCVATGELDFVALRDLPDDQVIPELCTLHGVGPWTADMFLMFFLNRPDVLPLGDAGLRRSFQLSYNLPHSPAAALMEEIAEPWRPYRTVGCWYLWRALDLQRPSNPW